MGEFGHGYEREFGEIQERVKHIQVALTVHQNAMDARFDKLHDRIEHLCSIYDHRCSALERWRAYLTGIGALSILLWGGVLAWWKAGR